MGFVSVIKKITGHIADEELEYEVSHRMAKTVLQEASLLQRMRRENTKLRKKDEKEFSRRLGDYCQDA